MLKNIDVKRCFPLFVFGTMFFVTSLFAEPTDDWTSREITRFSAPEAKQGVAVDDEYFYAIDNKQIGKYKKSDGKRVGVWKDEKEGSFIHLNAGFVKNGKLVCSHSNYPAVPMFSSVETWNAASMEHESSHSLGIGPGSLTWIADRDDFHYACFANYEGKTGDGKNGNAFTQIVRYDDQWRPTGGWGFPKELIEKFGGASSSCGAFGPGGFLYVTGHDAMELYVLDFPKAGSTLRLIATIPVALEGQAFSWDPRRPNVLYGIIRKSKNVVVIEIEPGSGFTKK